ncbi:DUF3573 domain-containing protein [Francisella noatunensis subsp. noatunensis]|nr:DUF3573 domain-containing protein [Francisella noatunensis subsp. noatunensis]
MFGTLFQLFKTFRIQSSIDEFLSPDKVTNVSLNYKNDIINTNIIVLAQMIKELIFQLDFSIQILGPKIYLLVLMLRIYLCQHQMHLQHLALHFQESKIR